MKDFFKFNKKIRLSVYPSPNIIYAKYSIILLLIVVLINGLNLNLIVLAWGIRYLVIEEPQIFIINLLFIILTLYINLDFLHALMGKQFIEISDKFIRVKKLTSDRTLNWSDVKSVEEMYRLKSFEFLSGVKLKKRDKNMRSFLGRDIVINFHKYANIEIEEFIEFAYRKKTSNFRIRF